MLIKERKQVNQEDPRITRTRQLLVRSLSELLREKSFQAITVAEITERATLNRVTFYAHFEDKFALLEYSMRELIRGQIDSQLGPDSRYSDENLRQLILLICSFLADIEHRCPPPHGQMEPLMEKQIKQAAYDVLLSWIKASTPRQLATTPTPEQAATVAAWSIYGAAQQWSQQAKPAAAEDFVKQIAPLIKNNLSSFFKQQVVTRFETAAAGRAPGALFASLFRFQLSY